MIKKETILMFIYKYVYILVTVNDKFIYVTLWIIRLISFENRNK